MNIYVIGPRHCGSTRLYNFIRFCFQKKNIEFHSAYKKKNENYEINIIKWHEFDISELKKDDIIFLPIRNLLDSAISRVSRKMCNNFLEGILHNTNLFNMYEKIATMIVKYENYSIYQLKEICKHLNLSFSNIEIIEIMKELDKMHSVRDNHLYKTHIMSKTHNTAGGKNNKFLYKDIKELKNVLNIKEVKEFLEKFKYI